MSLKEKVWRIVFFSIIILLNLKRMQGFEICDEQRRPLVPCNATTHMLTHVICDNYAVSFTTHPPNILFNFDYSNGSSVIYFKFINGDFMYHYPMTNYFKEKILHHLNLFRNRIASGLTVQKRTGQKFPAAKRMRQIAWSNELSYIAHAVGKGCNVNSGMCTRTLRFPNNHIFALHTPSSFPFRNDSTSFWRTFDLYLETFIEQYELSDKLELQNK